MPAQNDEAQPLVLHPCCDALDKRARCDLLRGRRLLELLRCSRGLACRLVLAAAGRQQQFCRDKAPVACVVAWGTGPWPKNEQAEHNNRHVHGR